MGQAVELESYRREEAGSCRNLNGKDILILASKVPYSSLRLDGYFVFKMPGIKTTVIQSN